MYLKVLKMKTFLLFFCILGYVSGELGPVVTIPQGSVQGIYQKSYDRRTFTAFEGIPYAKPPVGDLRFEEPVAANKWEGTLVANTNYMCPCFIPIPLLYGVKGTEDCLYMYVYVPRRQITGNENLDVVVHIHGGAFMLGSPKLVAGASFIMDKEVIYVSFNYRLAIFGFLSTEDDVVPGNNGLKDQVLALKWVKENIKYFGGNPDSITLTGSSAGAASVHYHYLSPMSKGLFHRGSSQSGTALQSWALTKNPLSKAKIVAASLNCSTESSKLMVQCLKGVPENSLRLAMRSVFVFMEMVPYVPFGPVIEKGGKNPFMSEHPYKLLKEGKVYDVPWVVSNTIQEGLLFIGVFGKKVSELDRRWNEIGPYVLDIHDTVAKADQVDVATKIRKHYLEDEPGADNVDSLVQMFTDRMFTVSCDTAIRAHVAAVKSPVYYYSFTYVSEMPPLFPGMKKGSSHSDDGRLLFPVLGTFRLGKTDKKMMNHLTEFVENYAKTGKPSFSDIDWKPIDSQSKEIDYLEINSPSDISMKKRKELGPKDFWNSLPIMENDKLF